MEGRQDRAHRREIIVSLLYIVTLPKLNIPIVSSFIKLNFASKLQKGQTPSPVNRILKLTCYERNFQVESGKFTTFGNLLSL